MARCDLKNTISALLSTDCDDKLYIYSACIYGKVHLPSVHVQGSQQTTQHSLVQTKRNNNKHETVNL